jgi:hypothetical protein
MYNHLKLKVKNEIKKAKQSWAKKLQSATYGIWKLAKRVTNKNRKADLTPLLKQCDSIQELTKMLADHFAKIASVQHDFRPNAYTAVEQIEEDEATTRRWKIKVSESEIKNILAKFPAGKAPGRDGIPGKFYMLLADFIAKPLAAICEASFDQRKFPAGWKKGVVIPIPKHRLKSPADVRPITLYPLPSKICEKIIKKNFVDLFEESFGQNQHGFRRGTSTTTALAHIMDAALRSFDQKESSGTAIISLDLSKAFDCLDHSLITTFLQQRNFHPNLVAWICDYLRNRTAMVKVSDQLSAEFPIERGVPQGTILGPLIFNTFVSDFETSNSEATVVKYADDINIVINFTDKDPQHIKKIIENEILNAMTWCEKKKMVLNTEKSSCVLNFRHPEYHPSSLTLPEKQSIKTLGVYLNNSFDWSTHVNEVYKKANQKFHVLKLIKPLVTPEDLHKIHNAYIRSILDYCSPVFVKLNRRLSEKLQRIDNRAHRIIFNQDTLRTCTCSKDNVRTRRELMSLKLFKKIEMNKQHPLHFAVPKKMTYTKHLNVSFCRTQKYQDSFIHYTTLLSNANKQNK